MKLIKYITAVLIFLFLITVHFSCKEKYPAMNFLNPIDREHDGFLDPDTYQVTEQAGAFRVEDFIKPQNTYVPHALPEKFDFKNLYSYNNSLESKIKKDNLISLEDIMNTDLIYLPADKISIGNIDENIDNKVKIKKKLLSNACLTAKVKALYRWFYLKSNVTSQNELKKENSLAKDENSYQEEEKLPLLDGFDKDLFPPLNYYESSFTEKALPILENQINIDLLDLELIAEDYINPQYLKCRVVYHIKKEDLYKMVPHLKH
ncbi:MAG: hypothetical protein OEZ22_07670 [Spirochaetia bacterium]|nr:hypothetical protein [Spirochaetia bacterium]